MTIAHTSIECVCVLKHANSLVGAEHTILKRQFKLQVTKKEYKMYQIN